MSFGWVILVALMALIAGLAMGVIFSTPAKQELARLTSEKARMESELARLKAAIQTKAAEVEQAVKKAL